MYCFTCSRLDQLPEKSAQEHPTHDEFFVAYATKICIAFSLPSAHPPVMRAKTEEFLNLLLWSADLLARPTFRNLTDSYEGWAYRNGLLRQAAKLERQHLLERDA